MIRWLGEFALMKKRLLDSWMDLRAPLNKATDEFRAAMDTLNAALVVQHLPSLSQAVTTSIAYKFEDSFSSSVRKT